MGPGPGEVAVTAGEPGEVVLVDEAGAEVGVMGKLEAHRPPGLLHLAFSVVVFTPDGRVILQRRASAKYHFAGLWSNTCCSHPQPGEPVQEAAARRLADEMGLACPLEQVGSFRYEATDPVSGLVERELDVVLVGMSGDEPVPDPSEVAEVGLVSLEALRADLAARPDRYTPWFASVLTVVERGASPPF